jgi:hypothetical protein
MNYIPEKGYNVLKKTAVVGVLAEDAPKVRNEIRRFILQHEDEMSMQTRDVLMQVYEWFGK